MPVIGIDKITTWFSHPTIGPIISHPNYDIINKLQIQLNTNAASIYSYLDNG